VRRVLAVASAVGVAAVLSLLRVSAHDRITTAVTWDREIAPIVAARCVTCHAGRETGTISLASYAAARPWARAIRQQVVTRQMPVWRAARGYGEFANDPSLSPFEISLIVAWVDGGAPQSPPVQSAAPVVAAADLRPPSLLTPPARTRDVPMPCDGRATPTGTLIGLRPRLDLGGSVRILAAWPTGERRILAWFRDGNPADVATYWLRTPLDLRGGAAIVTSSASPEGCSLALILR
jgi:hypothetical protein